MLTFLLIFILLKYYFKVDLRPNDFKKPKKLFYRFLGELRKKIKI